MADIEADRLAVASREIARLEPVGRQPVAGFLQHRLRRVDAAARGPADRARTPEPRCCRWPPRAWSDQPIDLDRLVVALDRAQLGRRAASRLSDVAVLDGGEGVAAHQQHDILAVAA